MKREIFCTIMATHVLPAGAAEIGISEVCKAAIGVVMARSPSIMKIDRSENGIEHLSYVRDDGTLWSYRCRLDGDQIIWATNTGRWRTHSLDSKITYSVSSDRDRVTVVEKYGDGSERSETYSSADF